VNDRFLSVAEIQPPDTTSRLSLQLAAAPVSGAVPQFEFRPPTHADVHSVAALRPNQVRRCAKALATLLIVLDFLRFL